QALVNAARRPLGMDIAFVAEFADGRRTFRFVDAAPGSARLEAGDSHELADTYCQGIVEGTIPGVIPDTRAEPAVSDLGVTKQLGIASYIGVPVRYGDGRLFGTMCCLAHTTNPGLGDGERQYLAVLAETIAAELEIEGRGPHDRARSVERIRRAIDDQAFFPVFQPIVDLRTGRVVGAEALTRFTDDDRVPMAWFAEAANIGLGVDLELAAAKRGMAEFSKDSGLYLSVNLSANALRPGCELVRTADMDPSRVVVELTEHVEMVDYPALEATAAELRSLSARLALDDTGAGMSSLRRILQLKPEIIKLDIVLTIGIDRDPVRQALARALTTFATEIGALVIAEGIETTAQLKMITELGVPYGQGFLLGRPGPLPLPEMAA
ncbi:MAG: sensor domain-containing phosphodiesterase, partial [Acidimicrobiales bacterium]